MAIALEPSGLRAVELLRWIAALLRNLFSSSGSLLSARRRSRRWWRVTAPLLGVAAVGHMMLNAMASSAEFERDMTASRIAEARAYLKANGRPVAGAVPFGYAADSRVKQLVVIPEEGAPVSRMFPWPVSKLTPSTIAAVANAQGWRDRKGQPWTARQVLCTLTSHVYAGPVIDGDGYRDGCHQALIERYVYLAVQNLPTLRRSRTPGRAAPPLSWSSLGLVSRSQCSRSMSTHTIGRGSVVHRYSRCRSTAGGRDPRKGVLVSAPGIESVVFQAAGLEQTGLTSKEEETALRSALRQVIFKADTGRIEILFKPSGDVQV